jgi:hypothetical protein
MKNPGRLLAIMALAVVTACSDDGRAGDGLEHPNWMATPTIRAGAVDGPAALADIFNVEVGPDGEILVAQSTVSAIAVSPGGWRITRYAMP